MRMQESISDAEIIGTAIAMGVNGQIAGYRRVMDVLGLTRPRVQAVLAEYKATIEGRFMTTAMLTELQNLNNALPGKLIEAKEALTSVGEDLRRLNVECGSVANPPKATLEARFAATMRREELAQLVKRFEGEQVAVRSGLARAAQRQQGEKKIAAEIEQIDHIEALVEPLAELLRDQPLGAMPHELRENIGKAVLNAIGLGNGGETFGMLRQLVMNPEPTQRPVSFGPTELVEVESPKMPGTMMKIEAQTFDPTLHKLWSMRDVATVEV